MKKFTRLIALTLFLVLSIVGCQSGTTKPDQTQPITTTITSADTTAAGEATQPTATETTPVADTVYPYEVRTADGVVTHTVESEPQRILSLSPTFTEIIFELGAGDRLVGRTDYCDYPAQTSEIPSVGSMVAPSVEAIVELEPDVVLVSFMEEEMVDKIQQSGASVIQMNTANSITGSYAIMEEIGRILNTNHEAAEMIQTIQQDIAAISSTVEGVPPVTTYYVAGFGKSGDYTAGGNTFMNDLIVAAGGDNVAKDVEGWTYTAEKLLEKDPEYIFIGSMSMLTEDFKATEPYNNLTAVKEGRVVEIDDNIISREGPRMAQAVAAIAKALHPDLFE